MTIIAELTTAIGRRNIKITKEFCEGQFPRIAPTLKWTADQEKKWPTIAKKDTLIWNESERGKMNIKVVGGNFLDVEIFNFRFTLYENQEILLLVIHQYCYREKMERCSIDV